VTELVGSRRQRMPPKGFRGVHGGEKARAEEKGRQEIQGRAAGAVIGGGPSGLVTEHPAGPSVMLDQRKGPIMKISTMALAGVFVAISSLCIAQTGAPSGQGSTTGDPAASSQNANQDTTGMSPSRSGSGTSTSGGSDANRDQGRDKMPDSSVGVRPYDKQNKPPK
jgi:hypothetical protein